jgi:hypothetical protein
MHEWTALFGSIWLVDKMGLKTFYDRPLYLDDN